MLISHHYRFVLVKPRKMAGTTVELALSPFLMPGDQATPVGPEEAMRVVTDGVHVGPIRRRVGVLRRTLRLRDHSPLLRAHKVVPQTRGYRVIAICRNPWDRAVSQFFWSMRRTDIRSAPLADQKAAFIRYTRRWGPRGWLELVYGRKRQRLLDSAHLYTVAGSAQPDYVIRFEALDADLAGLRDWLGLPDAPSAQGIRTKTESRPRSSDWTRFYDARTRDLVARECAREIAMFGYDFEGRQMPRGPFPDQVAPGPA